MTRLADLSGQDVALWGYGREGRAALEALRYLPERPRLTVYASDAAETDGDGIIWVEDGPTASQLASHDWVIKSPGISPYRSPAKEALAHGARFVSGSELWLSELPKGRVVCLTGSKGKSTTAALTAHLLREAGRQVVLAGNIGVPLLAIEDRTADVYVIELSSYQTQGLELPLDIALVLNLYPDHLDWHGSVEQYYQDKLALLRCDATTRFINARDPELSARLDGLPSCEQFNAAAGIRSQDNQVVIKDKVIAQGPWPGLPGPHQIDQVVAALTIADALDVPPERSVRALESYQGLPHRLAIVGAAGGLTYVDDSLASNPMATIAALRAYADRDVTLIVGGVDRGLDWTEFFAAVGTLRVAAVIGLGSFGSKLVDQLAKRNLSVKLARVEDMDAAVIAAQQRTPTGGVVLLSPGAPSQDLFRDFADRGAAFARAAGLSVNDV